MTPRTCASWDRSWPTGTRLLPRRRGSTNGNSPRGAGARPHPAATAWHSCSGSLTKRPPGYGSLPRFVASLLAEHHQATDLAATVFDRSERDRLDELRACLFHELVLRGVDIGSSRHCAPGRS
ncbi:DUF6183 family protein [Streptomyces sp. INA 01156]